MEFTARNHQRLATQVYKYLLTHGIKGPSRNGEVIRMPGVTTLIVERPWERVNLDPFRDANPYFHLIESIAMLAPLNDAKFLTYFAKNMASYTDDGDTYNAFYGTRLFDYWFDQLEVIINTLRKDPDSRQCVAQLWEPLDLLKNTKDKACNLMLLFSVDEKGRLVMTTFNRSNDAIWGILTGANVVHLSVFQEYVALALRREIGPWTHVSNNLHVYTANPKWPQIALQAEHEYTEFYSPSTGTLWTPSANSEFTHLEFRRSCHAVLYAFKRCIQSKECFFEKTGFDFLDRTVTSAFNSYLCHKNSNSFGAIECAANIHDQSWRTACQMWLERRYAL